MAVVAGVRGTTIIGTETIQKRDVADRIAQLQPEAAPLVTFTNALKKKKPTVEPKFEWFEDELVGNTVADAAGAGTTTSIQVSAADALKLRVGDILAASSGESILLTAFSGTSNTTLTVTRSFGAVAAQTLVATDQLVIVGNCADEGGSNPTFRSTQRVPAYNYIQIFRDPVQITYTASVSEVFGTPDDRMYLRKKVAIEHKRSIEQAFLFGDKAEVAGSNGGSIRATGGLINLITTNVTDANLTLTESEFETFLRTVFRYQPATGNPSKVLFASPVMISALNFWAKNALQVRSDEKTYGMRIASYRSGHGDLDIVRHWLLGDFTDFTKYNFVIDPALVSYRFLKGFDTKLYVDIGLKTSEQYLDEYRTHCGLQLELEKAHGILKNVTGFAS